MKEFEQYAKRIKELSDEKKELDQASIQISEVQKELPILDEPDVDLSELKDSLHSLLEDLKEENKQGLEKIEREYRDLENLLNDRWLDINSGIVVLEQKIIAQYSSGVFSKDAQIASLQDLLDEQKAFKDALGDLVGDVNTLITTAVDTTYDTSSKTLEQAFSQREVVASCMNIAVISTCLAACCFSKFIKERKDGQ